MGENRTNNIDIDIDKLKERINNVNVNDNTKSKSNKVMVDKVDRIADHLVSKFGAPGSRKFFCKCAWKLSEDEIWSAYEEAHKPKINYPLKYFIRLCSIKMGD